MFNVMTGWLLFALLASPDARPRAVEFVDIEEVPAGSRDESPAEFDTAILLGSVEMSLVHHSGSGERAAFEMLTSNWHAWVIENALLCEARLRKGQIGDKLVDFLTGDLMAADRKADEDTVRWRFELSVQGWPELPCDAWPVARLVHCVNDLVPPKECGVDRVLDLQLQALDSLKHSVR